MRINWDKLVRLLMADQPKLALLILLGGFAMLLWGRLLLRDVPRTAVADPKADNTTYALADPAWDGLMGSAPSSDQPERLKIRITDQVQQNIFQFKPDFYPQIANANDPAQTLTKLGRQSSDDNQQQRYRVESVRQSARELKLQSTLTGQTRRAVINNELLDLGE